VNQIKQICENSGGQGFQESTIWPRFDVAPKEEIFWMIAENKYSSILFRLIMLSWVETFLPILSFEFAICETCPLQSVGQTIFFRDKKNTETLSIVV
jgi:hypothetical protein